MLKGSKEAIGTDGLSFDDMLAQSQLLIIAGSETTATALSGMLYYLLAEPSQSSLSRLIHEIRSSFNTESDINLQSTIKLKYLQAVLEEGLRIYPPVPSILPRVTPKPGQIICDKFVPAGTTVGMHHYSAYHSAENFFDPDAFHPERWLEGEDSRFINDKKDAFHPFSHGPRNCLGKK
jgi:aspirochlorine biosynthesis cytochrome P450 monooxygenase